MERLSIFEKKRIYEIGFNWKPKDKMTVEDVRQVIVKLKKNKCFYSVIFYQGHMVKLISNKAEYIQ